MQSAFSWAPKVATVESVRVDIGMPVVRTDGRSVGRVITKFSEMGRFIYPWRSAGALRAWSSAIKTTFQVEIER